MDKPAKSPPKAISIHALREEGDRYARHLDGHDQHFYPRPPRGGRPLKRSDLDKQPCRFLSTPSARRATTAAQQGAGRGQGFLSTPSARRATRRQAAGLLGQGHFYPRPPRGGRPAVAASTMQPHEISIHALREEGDRRQAAGLLGQGHFYPRPPRGGRLQSCGDTRGCSAISIHALREEGDRHKKNV